MAARGRRGGSSRCCRCRGDAARSRGMQAQGRGARRRGSAAGQGRKEPRAGTPTDKKEKACEQSVSTIPEEPEPVPYVLRGDDIQALAIKLEDLEKLHAPHLPRDDGRIPVRRKFLIRKYQPKETKKKAHLLVAYPVFPRVPEEQQSFSGPGQFGDGCEKILPHHILGSLQEFKMEALARGNTQVGF